MNWNQTQKSFPSPIKENVKSHLRRKSPQNYSSAFRLFASIQKSNSLTHYSQSTINDLMSLKDQKTADSPTIRAKFCESYAANAPCPEELTETEMRQNLIKQESKVIQLRQKLRNTHHFYKIRIQQERMKTLKHNESMLHMLEELQRVHGERVLNLRKSLQQVQQEKEEMNNMGSRIHQVKNAIQQILTQSQSLKQDNSNLQKLILEKKAKNAQKEAQRLQKKEELNELRRAGESFQRLMMKERRRNRELVQMMKIKMK